MYIDKLYFKEQGVRMCKTVLLSVIIHLNKDVDKICADHMEVLLAIHSNEVIKQKFKSVHII